VNKDVYIIIIMPIAHHTACGIESANNVHKPLAFQVISSVHSGSN